MDVVIVCHTEFGVTRNGQVVATKEPTGVTVGVSNLQTIANVYGAKVTYAVCPEVTSFLPDVDGEIGVHIHPGWEEAVKQGIRYFIGDNCLRNKCGPGHSTVLIDYTLEQQKEFIAAGVEVITTSLRKPKVFLAGRWSLNEDTLSILPQFGLTHDCSAIPHSRQYHCDWSRLPRICMPYHSSGDDYQKKGQNPVLIVPVSQMIKGGCVNPETAAIYGHWWLELCFEEYYRRKQPLFHICLHSPCMVDDYFVMVMDKLLRFIIKHKNINFKYVSEVEEYAQ